MNNTNRKNQDNELWHPFDDPKPGGILGMWEATISGADEDLVVCTVYGATKVEANNLRNEIIASHNRMAGEVDQSWKMAGTAQITEIQLAAAAIETKAGEDVCLIVHQNMDKAKKIAKQIVLAHNLTM